MQKRVFIVLALFLSACGASAEKSEQGKTPAEQRETDSTPTDGDYDLWESFPVDLTSHYCDEKTIEGGNLHEWGVKQELLKDKDYLKKHPEQATMCPDHVINQK